MEAVMDQHWSAGVRRLLSAFVLSVCGAGLVVLVSSAPVGAQFSSGSTGANGAFPPLPAGFSLTPTGTRYLVWNMSTGLVRYCSVYDTTNVPETCTTELGTGQVSGIPQGGLATGVFNFTAVDVRPAASPGALDVYLVGNVNNSPLTILADTIHVGTNVTLHAEGMPGAAAGSGLIPNQSFAGGRPGPGGFAGGSSGVTTIAAANGNPGFGPAGGAGGIATANCPAGGNATVPPNTAQSLPFLGGSGGGGGASNIGCGLGHLNGGGGGGGGGAVLMAATTQIQFDFNALIYLYGGAGASSQCGCFEGAGGSGGNLRLVAPTLIANSGSAAYFTGGSSSRFGAAPGGTISLEGDTHLFAMALSNQRSGNIVVTPGAVSPTTTPTLRITSIGGLTVPTAPTGNTATPDVSFPTPPTGPVTVTFAAANIPVGTTAKVRVTPQVGSFTEVTSTALTGSSTSSTANASVTIPAGYGAITASATFACDGTICLLLPANDRVNARVEVVADATGSRATIVKADGTRIALPMADY
jgi:hypothetical protein